MADRFEIHAHTEMSNKELKDSTNKIEELIDKAVELGLRGLAITDHENLCAHITAQKHYQKLKKKNPDLDFKLVLGDEIYLVNERKYNQKYYHFILHAKNALGHRALRELSSRANILGYVDRGYMRLPTLKSELEGIVKRFPNSLIASSACLGGEIATNILKIKELKEKGDQEGINKCTQEMHEFILYCKKLFGDDFYLEVAPGRSEEQLYFNKVAVHLAKHYNLKIVIGTDAHYLSKKEAFSHETFLKSKDGEREVASFYEYAYLQPESDIIENLKFTGIDYEEACKNSMEALSKCEDYTLEKKQKIPKENVKDYPKLNADKWLEEIGDPTGEKYPYIKECLVSDEKQERNYINEVLQGLVDKGKLKKEYIVRIEEECDILRDLSNKLEDCLHAYTNTLQTYIDIIWECGSLVMPGRGSAAGWLGNYAKGITQLDPLEYNLYHWRFLNKERPELPDIDIDLSPSLRPVIMNRIKEYHHDRIIGDELEKKNLGITYVAAFGEEKTKKAIHTACAGYRSHDYPNGINNDDANYIASMIPQERGFVWSLNDCIKGNPEKKRKPVKKFIDEVNKYPKLIDVLCDLEDLISQTSINASGVVLFDGDPYEKCCFMRNKDGDICTQWDLHDVEWCGNVKYDFLVTKFVDKLIEFSKIMRKQNIWENDLTLRQLYSKYLHPDVLPLNDSDIWEALANGKVMDCFQFSTPLGLTSAKKCHCNNIMEMSDLTSIMRLIIDPEKENPVDRYMRIKNDISQWYKECEDYGLTKEEIKRLEPHFLPSFGNICQQEQLMVLFMKECGFTLGEANWGRSVVSKKKMKEIPKLKQMCFDGMKKMNFSEKMQNYIWDFGVSPLLGYGFPLAHAAAYSLVGVQGIMCAVKYNEIFWDTACLRVNAQVTEKDIKELEKVEEDTEEKKKQKTSKYDEIGKAIRNMQLRNIEVSYADINKSGYTFEPDVKNNRILYGLACIPNLNVKITSKIINNRPYLSLNDFLVRMGGDAKKEDEIAKELKKKATTEERQKELEYELKIIRENKLQKKVIISLIKAGSFTDLDKTEPIKHMGNYCKFLYLPKTKFQDTYLNNIKIPEEYIKYTKLIQFREYLMKNKVQHTEEGKQVAYFKITDKILPFYEEWFSIDNLVLSDEGDYEVKKDLKDGFDNMYKKALAPFKEWVKNNEEEILRQVNNLSIRQNFVEMCKGIYSKAAWEMESLCFYHEKHELSDIDFEKYDIEDFNSISEVPVVEEFKRYKNKELPIFKLFTIAGTVIAKDKTKGFITLNTTTGLVNVKVDKDLFSAYDKRISNLLSTGKKQIVEESWFTRGNMLLVTGYRNGSDFRTKTYKSTYRHHLEKISIVNNKIIVQRLRKVSN